MSHTVYWHNQGVRKHEGGEADAWGKYHALGGGWAKCIVSDGAILAQYGSRDWEGRCLGQAIKDGKLGIPSVTSVVWHAFADGAKREDSKDPMEAAIKYGALGKDMAKLLIIDGVIREEYGHEEPKLAALGGLVQ
mmetsp:Transcript_114577/g.228003  ORF Transcript_114577/g.228003 Transcript_114577/m.228003 type:complete len:135 (+) Transcript_114577:530-934(+)|eukprot:CAMPEP_0172678866 /NCGR_PEP_ID=MMETSP1074-20121228/15671_1 /TAXON_ID=2916 /ORGANISM="Ceratium fusus, Strain PA161109" /LENGTH=134 /DNA_ID=CAMNT_0013496961 /DNA_START=538 /DNA_END=942 /DNA_ORIENTATION=+